MARAWRGVGSVIWVKVAARAGASAFMRKVSRDREANYLSNVCRSMTGRPSGVSR